MQVTAMAACMESQADILECTAGAQSGRREVTVCFSPMSMLCTHRSLTVQKGNMAQFIPRGGLVNVQNEALVT